MADTNLIFMQSYIKMEYFLTAPITRDQTSPLIGKEERGKRIN